MGLNQNHSEASSVHMRNDKESVMQKVQNNIRCVQPGSILLVHEPLSL
jgi:hypothetical protein